MTATGLEFLRVDPPTDRTDQASRQHDDGEGDIQREDRQEGRRRQGPQDPIAQCPGADAPSGEGDDGSYCRFDPVEDTGHRRQVTVDQIDPG